MTALPTARRWGADFFTTEVWTWRGLITFYTVFVIDPASRRVQIVGSTPHPGELVNHDVLICDRDRKWSGDTREA